MKRQRFSYDLLLHLIGIAAKFLFVGTFISIVVCLLTAAFGATAIALDLATVLWDFFWRVGLTLFCLLSITIAWEALQ